MRNGQGEWVNATQPPTTDNLNGTAPVVYRFVIQWNTCVAPLGNNGKHIIQALTAVKFQMYENQQLGTGLEGGPEAVTTNVVNCIVTDVSASNGTVDYFKWDPDSDDPALRDPVITFTIADTTPH